MALGGSFLILVLLLRPAVPSQDPSLEEEEEDTMYAAPPHLIALVPAAATATVDAGYTAGGSSTVHSPVAVVTPEGVSLAAIIHTATEPSSTLASKKPPSILIVGDTRYQWQEWSPWHCNCAQGSMSRVRDITYSVPGVVLDPAQYDVLRFQRVVCSYKTCSCEEGQCDRLQVTCEEEEEHICALRDIERDQRQKRKDFWARLHAELKNLWMSLKEVFPRRRKGCCEAKIRTGN